MQDKLTKIVIIGATSAIAEHCAREWVAQGAADLVLVARNAPKAERVAADLRVRSPGSRVSVRTVDFGNARAIRVLVDDIAAEGAIHRALIAHGSLSDQAQCQQDLDQCQDALLINGVSPALFAEAIAGHMQSQGQGTLGIIGSVAGDRGRRSNYVYGAAKGLVARYAQGLQHRLAGNGVKVVLIKPGPTDTPMTAHLKQQGGLASVESVARLIVQGMGKGSPVVYAPAKWALIMMVIRHLPAFVFNKLKI